MTDFSTFTDSTGQPTVAPTVTAPLQTFDLSQYTPASVAQFTDMGSTNLPALDAKGPQQTKALIDKYTKLGQLPQWQAAPISVRNALMQYDANRVANGNAPVKLDAVAPLQSDETGNFLRTATTGQPATPPPSRTLLNLPGNALADLSTILHAIPRLPVALYHEALALPNIGSEITKNEKAGDNIIQAVAHAPGIRMIPGAYTVGNLLGGGLAGIKEEITHPVMSALDVLPVMSEAAKLTTAGTASVAREAAGLVPHPLTDALFRRISPETPTIVDPVTGVTIPNLIPKAGMQPVIDLLKTTGLGQNLETAFANRDQIGIVNRAKGLPNAVARGDLSADAVADKFGAPLGELAQIRRATQYAVDEGKKVGIDLPRQTAITGAMTTDTLDPAVFTPQELAWGAKMRDLTQATGDWMVSNNQIQQAIMGGKAEFLPNSQGTQLTAARAAAQKHVDYVFARNEILNPTLAPEQITDRLRQVTNIPTPSASTDRPFGAAARAAAARGEIITGRDLAANVRAGVHALAAQGFDTADLMKAAKAGDWSAFRTLTPDQLTRVTTEPLTETAVRGMIPRSLGSMADRTPAQARLAAYDQAAASNLRDAIKQGDWSRASSTMYDLQRRTTPPTWATPEMSDAIARFKARDEFLNSTTSGLGRYTEESAAKLSDRATQMERQFAPARFKELIRDRTQQNLIRVFNPTGVSDITKAILNETWTKVPGWDEKLARSIADDARNNWMSLRDNEGLNPVFMHTVQSHQLQMAARGAGADVVPTRITSANERAGFWDAAPGINNIAVALTAQQNEILSHAAITDAVDQVVRGSGHTLDELKERFADQARRDSIRDQTLDYRGHLSRRINQQYAQFDPVAGGYNWGGQKLSTLAGDQIYIPKALNNQLRQLVNPTKMFGGLLDPTTRLFRTAVVGLSPKAMLHTLIGGAIQAVGETGWRYFTNLPDAMKLAREGAGAGAQGAEIAELLHDNPQLAGVLNQTKTFFEDVNPRDLTSQAQSVAQYLHGKTLGRLASAPNGLFDKLNAGFTGITDRTYGFHNFADNLNRAASYLAGKESGLARGLTEEAAQRAGFEAARRALVDYSRLTPFEMSTIKSVVPFYGVMQQAIKYVLRYPMDHPLRASFLAKLADAESKTMGDALGDKFLSAVMLGKPDAYGHVSGLNFSQLSPFTDVAHQLTLQGFLGATNPVIKTALESVGVNYGNSELYPSLKYDPETGRLTTSHPNPLFSLLGNTVPQANVVTALLGANTQFKHQLANDPAAAMRTLVSEGGLPVVLRDYNMPGEYFKAEAARETAQKTVLDNAIKTGNWTQALRYPALVPMYQKISTLVNSSATTSVGVAASNAAAPVPENILQQYAPPTASALLKTLTQQLPVSQGGPSQFAGGS